MEILQREAELGVVSHRGINLNLEGVSTLHGGVTQADLGGGIDITQRGQTRSHRGVKLILEGVVISQRGQAD